MTALSSVFSILLACGLAMNDETREPENVSESTGGAALPGGEKTLGGRQFWGDVEFFRGFRIQQSVLTKQFRLLDPQDVRHESGTLHECQKKLQQIKAELKLPPMSGKAVVLIHGIGRSSKCFSSMAKTLEKDGYTVVSFEYPSTRVTVQDSAEFLHKVLTSLSGIDSIDVVGHSMGGVLLRAYLKTHPEPRFHRAVMLGVPNKGAQLADVLKNNALFKAILGPAGQQLVTHEGGLISQLPTPKFEFGVLAGGRSANRGYNPLLPGDNDSTVTVASTRLPGAADFVLLPVIHSFLMTDADCIAATRHFLANGRFSPDRPAAPISDSDVSVIQ